MTRGYKPFSSSVKIDFDLSNERIMSQSINIWQDIELDNLNILY
jgi:hypothetical protein